jgi:hypothetical protein
MRKIRIHLDHEAGALLERPGEALDVRRAQPLLARTVDDVEAPGSAREQVRQLPGTVRRGVIHDQDLESG